MEMTPKQVIEALAKTGRIVKARTLTDWRTKKLLPRLKDKNRGNTDGKAFYYWDQTDIVDQVAFVADLGGETKTALALWCCGFSVDLEKLRTTWIEVIGSLSKDWAKQNMASVETRSEQSYFDSLEDRFHKLATHVQRQSEAPNSLFPENSYELVQAVLFLIFSLHLPDDFDDEINSLNQYLSGLTPGQDAQLVIDRSHLDSLRKLVNLFNIKEAVENATHMQLEQAQRILKTFVRLIEFACGLGPRTDIGLTQGRIFCAVLAPIALAVLLRVLRLSSGKFAAELFDVIADDLDRCQADIKQVTHNEKRVLQIPDSISERFRKEASTIWQQLIDGIARDLQPDKIK